VGSISDATGKFAERIAGLLEVFDLSFFVAGAAALGGIVAWIRLEGIELPSISGELVFGAVVGAYVLGLACFAIGRFMRVNLFRVHIDAGDHLTTLAKAHGLDELDTYERYVGFRRELYGRLWVLIRTEEPLRETFELAKRYWVLGAAYDGLSMALLFWLLPVFHPESGLEPPYVAGFAIAIAAAVALAWNQARQYKRYQIEELAATAAYWHERSQSGERAVPTKPRPELDLDAP
jgi:hypothetical protein